MSLMRLSVKKAAHADMSRAAYRKSGAVLAPLRSRKIKKVTSFDRSGGTCREPSPEQLSFEQPPSDLSSGARWRLSTERPAFSALVQWYLCWPDGMTSQKPLHLKTFSLISVMVIAGPLGNVLLSKGMKQAGRLSLWPPAEALHTAVRVLGTGPIWLGIASLLTFFLANVLVLSWADYSYVQPASSVGYGVAALLGYLILGEPVSPLRWLGIGIICLGVFVVGQTSPRSLERSSTGLERSPTGLERS